MKFCGSSGSAVDATQDRKNLRVSTRDQNIMAATFVAQHGAYNLRDLRWRLALGKHDFRVSLPQRAVMINLGEVQIFIRKVLQSLDGPRRRKFSRGHFFQQSLQ